MEDGFVRTCLTFWASAWCSDSGVGRQGATGRRVADEDVRMAGSGGNIMHNKKCKNFWVSEERSRVARLFNLLMWLTYLHRGR